MEAVLPALGQVLNTPEFRERIYEIAVLLNQSDPERPLHRTYSPEEIRQMSGGFAALLDEAVQQRGTEVRTLYFETLLPGLVAQGFTLSAIIEWNATYMSILSCEALLALAPEHRGAATLWLARFTGRYLGDIVGVLTPAAAR